MVGVRTSAPPAGPWTPGRAGRATGVHEAQGATGLLGTQLRPIYGGRADRRHRPACEVPPGVNWMIHLAVPGPPGDVSSSSRPARAKTLLRRPSRHEPPGPRGARAGRDCRCPRHRVAHRTGLSVWASGVGKGTSPGDGGNVQTPSRGRGDHRRVTWWWPRYGVVVSGRSRAEGSTGTPGWRTRRTAQAVGRGTRSGHYGIAPTPPPGLVYTATGGLNAQRAIPCPSCARHSTAFLPRRGPNDRRDTRDRVLAAAMGRPTRVRSTDGRGRTSSRRRGRVRARPPDADVDYLSTGVPDGPRVDRNCGNLLALVARSRLRRPLDAAGDVTPGALEGDTSISRSHRPPPDFRVDYTACRIDGGPGPMLRYPRLPRRGRLVLRGAAADRKRRRRRRWCPRDLRRNGMRSSASRRRLGLSATRIRATKRARRTAV